MVELPAAICSSPPSRPRRRSRKLASSPSSPSISGRARSYSNSPSRVRLKRRRSEEHTSELQSLMLCSYAAFYLKKKPLPQIGCLLTDSSIHRTQKPTNSIHTLVTTPHTH